MENYRKAVEYYARSGKANLMHNAGSEHALIIFENIFENAKEHIRIAAGDLCNIEVVNTEAYIAAMKTFLDRDNTRLDIMLTHYSDEWKGFTQNSFFAFLIRTDAFRDSRVRIKNAEGRVFEINDKPIHFCTADGKMYRLETDTVKRQAECNFADPDTTRKLEKSFDEAFNSLKNTVNLQ